MLLQGFFCCCCFVFQQCFHVMFGLFVLYRWTLFAAFIFLFIKNLYSRMCVCVYKYWKRMGDKEDEKRWNQCSLRAKNARPMFAHRNLFFVFYAFLLRIPVSFFFFSHISYILSSSQCQQHWLGQMMALPESNEKQKNLCTYLNIVT